MKESNKTRKQDKKGEEGRISHRKLFRVKNWRDELMEGVDKDIPITNKIKLEKKREEGINNPDKHEFILMTDTDDYLKEGIELLDGYHHLDGKNEALISMDGTAEAKDNQLYYDEFQEDCCKSF